MKKGGTARRERMRRKRKGKVGNLEKACVRERREKKRKGLVMQRHRDRF